MKQIQMVSITVCQYLSTFYFFLGLRLELKVRRDEIFQMDSMMYVLDGGSVWCGVV